MFSKSLVWLAPKVCGLSVDPPAKRRCSKNTPHLGQPSVSDHAPSRQRVSADVEPKSLFTSALTSVMPFTWVMTAQPPSTPEAGLSMRISPPTIGRGAGREKGVRYRYIPGVV